MSPGDDRGAGATNADPTATTTSTDQSASVSDDSTATPPLPGGGEWQPYLPLKVDHAAEREAVARWADTAPIELLRARVVKLEDQLAAIRVATEMEREAWEGLVQRESSWAVASAGDWAKVGRRPSLAEIQRRRGEAA